MTYPLTQDLGDYSSAVVKLLKEWQDSKFVERLWHRDPLLWSGTDATAELVDRLGWLALPGSAREQLAQWREFAAEISREGVRHVVLLGMGGSSLAPEVFQKVFGNADGHPELLVLDSTHPSAVKAIDLHIDPARSLFVVSSKSGTTSETLSFFRYFWARTREIQQTPGRQFIAITDPDTPLVQLARDRAYRRVFPAPPDVGGRYSALSAFGMVPAALIGVDVERIADRARKMSEDCSTVVPENPGLRLGSILAELGIAGRDKVTFVASPSLASFPDWLEQLIAESTGKDDKGLIPVAGEPLGSLECYGKDRLFVHLELGSSEHPETGLEQLHASHPIVRIRLSDKYDIAQEFFLWEFAVASAGARLGVHPFNQPDVQLAKDLARKAMEKKEETLHATAKSADVLLISDKEKLARKLKSWEGLANPGDYISIQAYIAPSPEHTGLLQGIRTALRDRLHVATTAGYGPRFLHSTGQLHKGGPNSGLFLQLVDEIVDDVAVPETNYSFGSLIQAQAEGDYEALRRRGRRIVRVNLGSNVVDGLARLSQALEK